MQFIYKIMFVKMLSLVNLRLNVRYIDVKSLGVVELVDFEWKSRLKENLNRENLDKLVFEKKVLKSLKFRENMENGLERTILMKTSNFILMN